jgi:hypothetical protein
LGILLIVIIAVAIPISYFVANEVVSDAVYKFGFASRSGTITVEQGVTFAGEFIRANSANIPLTIDLVNITIFVYGGSPYDGNLHFTGPTGVPDAIYLGNVIVENKIVPTHGQAGVSATLDFTTENALSLIQDENYNVRGSYLELTVSGSYLFWHITPQFRFL